jgi:hypothetical protein
MAARTGNACSNPDCGAPTSGPQDEPTKALNVGVAAHITGAAAGGERYNPSLSSEQRRHPDNGIWLCQTCAKLIDNDSLQFTEMLLRTWKADAEGRALRAIGKTVGPAAESESQRKLRAILPKRGQAIRLTQMNSGNAVFLLGLVASSSVVQLFDSTEYHVRVGKAGNEGWSRTISLVDVTICFDEQNLLELQVPRF